MAQCHIRCTKEDSKRIPLDLPIWFVLLTINKNKIEEEIFQTTKGGKVCLLETIKELKSNKIYFKIYGVWSGNWNTDIFDMDKAILKKRLERDLGIIETEIKKR